MKEWKKYVGYDSQDQSSAGEESANPGPLDNSHLLTGISKNTIFKISKYGILNCSRWDSS